MTEVAEYAEPSTTADLPDSPLVAWAREASAAHGIARSLVATSFVPKAMQGKAHEATAAILTGQEMGMQPMASLRNINLIQGVPALTAIALRGLVQSAGHDIWVEEDSDTKAVVCGQRKGSERVQKSVWTIERAKRLGLAEKDNWRRQPGNMLVARATAEVCRRVASDVLLGLPYAVEELDDDEPVKAKRTVKRKPAPEPVAVAEPDMEPPAVESKPEPMQESPADEPGFDDA